MVDAEDTAESDPRTVADLSALADGTLDPDKEPWSILFAKEFPAQARFSGGGLWMAIRADGSMREIRPDRMADHL